MRHVDEGTLHAWLDAEITDPAELAWIEEHLRWCTACATRLAEERATLEQANELLSATAPAGLPPGFQEVLARADARSVETAESLSVSKTPHDRQWLLQAGWAASLIFAVGIGWLMRDALPRDSALPSQPVVAERVTGTPSNQVADAGPAQEAALSARAADPADTPAARGATAPPPARSRQQPADAAAPPALAPPSVAAPAAPAAPMTLAPAAPPAARAQAGANSAGGVAAPPPGREPLREAAADARAEAPAERAAATTERAVANVAVGTPAPPAPPIEWRTVPRTEAAVRSGMPLYGIGGIEPVVTTVRSDGRAVRTTYRLETGVLVELEQERAPFGSQAALPSAEATRRALAPGAGVPALANATTEPRVWSETRANVRVSLRTTSDVADLSALGARLRIE